MTIPMNECLNRRPVDRKTYRLANVKSWNIKTWKGQAITIWNSNINWILSYLSTDHLRCMHVSFSGLRAACLRGSLPRNKESTMEQVLTMLLGMALHWRNHSSTEQVLLIVLGMTLHGKMFTSAVTIRIPILPQERRFHKTSSHGKIRSTVKQVLSILYCWAWPCIEVSRDLRST